MSALRTSLMILLLGALAGNVCGEPRRDYRHDARANDDRNRRPVREVIGEVEHNYRGRVVDVQAPRPGANDDMYRVRVLQDGGRVKTLRVPAERHGDKNRR
ncbi:MAG: hypothetical protein JWM78_2768 [Verrucomicrobiaceae bacterium]|nr:hypothetical protein [Verrucomicrobiaceae bacterium]